MNSVLSKNLEIYKVNLYINSVFKTYMEISKKRCIS